MSKNPEIFQLIAAPEPEVAETMDSETETVEGEEKIEEVVEEPEMKGMVKEQILQYHIKMDKIKLRGDIYDEFNSFNEINQFNLSETEQFNDGLAFFGVQVIID